MTESDPQTIGIGELMVKAGFLSNEDLNEAQEIAKGGRLYIGRVLVMSGFVSDEQLKLAQSALEQLRNGSIGLDDAINLLQAANP